MRLAIISDVHANLEALCAALDDIAAQRVDRILCLGDIVGYNADPAGCIALLQGSNALCVAGNHDRAVAGLITTDGFSDTAARAVAWTRARLSPDALAFLASLPLVVSLRDSLVAVHGTLYPDGGGCERTYLDSDGRRRQCIAALAAHPSHARICAFGHTHQLGVFEFRDGRMWALRGDEVLLRDGAYYLVNPGSIGQPRIADWRATYLVVDTEFRAVTVHRVEYAFSVPLTKTRDAGLIPRSSFLPAPVRKALKWGVRASGLSGVAERMRRPRAEAGSEVSAAEASRRPATITALEVVQASRPAEAGVEGQT